jgi:HK97 family phage prohead protease
MKTPRTRRVPDKVVHKTVVSEETKGLEFILSDATPDRYDDIIMTDGWELANFKKNPIALFAHSGSFPIGKWKNVRIEDNALRGTLDLAPEGTSERIDEIRRLVDADILRAVSVGFTPIEYEERKGDTYGLVYTEQELVECSLVSVPANPSALIQAKSLGISADTQGVVFKKIGTANMMSRAVCNREEALGKFLRGQELVIRLNRKMDKLHVSDPEYKVLEIKRDNTNLFCRKLQKDWGFVY